MTRSLSLAAALVVAAFVLCGHAQAACGLASWYGKESGNRTASGAYFDGSQILVAHKSYPFGTRLKITYNGRSVIAPVLDRGPFIKGRELDLSYAAAKRIGLIRPGVARVCWEKVR